MPLLPLFRTGLALDAALSMGSYVFINKPKSPSVLTPAADAALDFLAPCDSLEPKGALVAKLEPSLNAVAIRSLLYPGFFHYTFPGVPGWGYFYQGNGVKNADLAFMLP